MTVFRTVHDSDEPEAFKKPPMPPPEKETFRSFLPNVLWATAFLGVFYLAAAGTAWSVRNPTANSMTFWSHLPDALTFRALPQFQENP